MAPEASSQGWLGAVECESYVHDTRIPVNRHVQGGVENN